MTTDFTDKRDEMAKVDSTGPDITALRDELSRSATHSGITSRVDGIENTRFCRWPGQTADGKKHQKNQGDAGAFPWEGASDTRIYLADEVINGLVDLTVTAFWRSNLKVSPNKLNQSSDGVASHALMDWMIRSKMSNELVRDAELYSQYIYNYGWAGLHITWQQESGMKEEEIKLETLIQTAQQAQPGSIWAELPALIQNPDAEDQVAEIFMGAFPELKKKKAKKAVRELREEGECDFPVSRLVKNQACIAALAPYDEIAFPPETTDIQSARVVFRRCFMSEVEVMQHVENDEWDEEWAKEAINCMGKFSGISDFTHSRGLSTNATEDRSKLVEVVYAYQKAMDEDDNLGVWCTVFCPHVGDKWGKYELLDYDHGQYPFVIGRSEMIHRKIIESRGVPEIVFTWQNELKAQRDSIFDYTSITTIPPIQVPKTRAGTLKIGPAVQVPVMRPGEISWMNLPDREPNVAFQLIESIKAQVDSYFGRPTEKVPPAITQMRQQRIVNTFLHGWTEAFKQVLSLSVQYLGPETVARITGINTEITQEEQELDISCRFDVRELQSDLVTEKLTAISQFIVPADRAGMIDWSKLLPAMLRLVDPTIAQEVITDKASATQKMFEETNADVLSMSAGNPPKLRENDPAAQTRLMFTEQIMKSNPKYMEAITKGDEVFKNNLESYVQNLQFSVQQQQNAMTGRLGVDPNAVQS